MNRKGEKKRGERTKRGRQQTRYLNLVKSNNHELGNRQ